jgi:CRP-like cAMP-binding protein
MLARWGRPILGAVDIPDERIRRLQTTSLFGATSDATVAYILETATRVEVDTGGFFFREGERGGSIFWLDEGELAITRAGGGKEVELRRIHPGDVFGEAALLDFGPRSASVRAVAPSVALEITASMLRQIAKQDLEQYTLLTMNLGRELSRRLRSVETLLLASSETWAADHPTPIT